MKRRALLGTLAAVGASMTGGCLDQSTPPETTTKLGLLAIENYDTESGHEFDIRVERDGDIVHRSSHSVEKTSLPQISGPVLDCPWRFIEGKYTVSARVDDSEWLGQPLAVPFDTVPACVITTVRYGRLPSEGGEQSQFDIEVEANCDTINDTDGGCQAYQNTSETNA